jgi:hypothetical protein
LMTWRSGAQHFSRPLNLVLLLPMPGFRSPLLSLALLF